MKPLSRIPKPEQEEADELNNLLYALHTTSIVDHIGLSTIANETSKDPTLTKIKKYVNKEGQRWIPKGASSEARKFQQILPELTLTENGILLKGDRMVLPSSLHCKAIELAHRGAHPGQSGMERRLRFYFFFYNMYDKVKDFVQGCSDCDGYVDKKTKEPLNHYKIPEHCWNTVAVDLFGPLPSAKHVVVVHDLASRLPAAKLVSLTMADEVIPVLEDIYNTYGNPELQISDNGPPFISKKMVHFAGKRDKLRTTPPHHPNANPAETCMKTIGKAMKVCHHNGSSEKEALQETLFSYRQTPHPATGILPANMMFRDGMKSQFPRRSSTQAEIMAAKERDLHQKARKQMDVNSSKYWKTSNFVVGDLVLVRNYTKKLKFNPEFTTH